MQLKNVFLALAAASSALALTSQEVVSQMGLGWNLGNTLEAFGDWINGSTVQQYETAWGNPVATKELINAIKSNGFKSIRIPVSWSNLMGSNYTINPQLLNRVGEVVNYVLDSGLYAIVNIHYDNGWFEKFGTSESTTAFNKYNRIWTQVSSFFKDYDEHLIFESLNEEGCWNDVWNRYSNAGNKSKAYGTLNDINQKFVDIVRASGGNNKNRHLLLAGYCTDIDLTVDSAYKIPKDSVANKLIVSVHYYTPSTFTILEKDEDWGKFTAYWGTDAEVQALTKDFDKLKARFVDNGIPVIIGEYGTTLTNKDKNSVHKYLFTCAQYATSLGICPMLWDNGEHFDRKKLAFKDPELGEFYKHHSQVIASGSSSSSGSNTGSTCWSEPDYPCCKEGCRVIYQDDHLWGVENGEWCGLPESCNVAGGNESCPSYPAYPCCETCNVVSFEEGEYWGVENNQWCSIKDKCIN